MLECHAGVGMWGGTQLGGTYIFGEGHKVSTYAMGTNGEYLHSSLEKKDLEDYSHPVVTHFTSFQIVVKITVLK